MISRLTFEIFPASLVELKTKHLPPKARVAIACPHNIDGIYQTLDLTQKLSSNNFQLIPHLSARTIKNKKHLKQILKHKALQKAQEIFVIGGDPQQVGPYTSSLELLAEIFFLNQSFTEIGIAGYPEGHPKISDQALWQALKDKQDLAKKLGIKMYIVSQICFSETAIINWIKKLRQNGITLPVEIGIVGPVKQGVFGISIPKNYQPNTLIDKLTQADLEKL
ncbi:methylenetetrahydrofolate reductase, partial [Candidatus Daviesbacteria bacterium]|nr:methylenetetrahydrofolate reductase [Candidatus Daviesbacteria bacterium]